MSGVEVVEKGKEPHDFSVRITYTREAPDEVEAEEEGVSEVDIIFPWIMFNTSLMLLM